MRQCGDCNADTCNHCRRFNDVKKVVRRALPADWDIEITEVTNGKEALEAVEAEKAEVLFLDLTMPELDGFDVLSYLNEHKTKIIVIVISADIQPEAKKLVDKLGAFLFLHKPLNSEQLEIEYWNDFFADRLNISCDQVKWQNLLTLFPNEAKYLKKKINSVFVLNIASFSYWEHRSHVFSHVDSSEWQYANII
jgi:two-component system chemotaxis response regulator CheY